MPYDLIFFKVLHLLSVVVFMGSIFFITYVLDVVKHQNPKATYKDFAPKISERARNIMFINIPLLLVSGLYILFFYYDFRFLSLAMILKLVLAGFIVLVFYTSDWITKKTDHIKGFHHFFHHGVIAMMVSVVILSQMM